MLALKLASIEVACRNGSVFRSHLISVAYLAVFGIVLLSGSSGLFDVFLNFSPCLSNLSLKLFNQSLSKRVLSSLLFFLVHFVVVCSTDPPQKDHVCFFNQGLG